MLLTLRGGKLFCFVVAKYRAFIEVFNDIWKELVKKNEKYNVNGMRAECP